jgi:hypothetical protein
MFTFIPYLVDLGHVAIRVCLVHLWDWHAVDLSASDDAARDWKLRAGAHEVGIDLASALTAFVDAPVVMLASVKNFLMGRDLLTRQSATVHGDNHQPQRHWASSCCIDP